VLIVSLWPNTWPSRIIRSPSLVRLKSRALLKANCFGQDRQYPKSTRVDAKLTARYAYGKHLPEWTWPPTSPNIRELQALLRRIEDLLEMLQMEKNRLDTADASVVSSIRTLIALLEKELITTRAQLRNLINNDPDLQRRRDLLETIPGIAESSSAPLLVALSEHYRFTCAKQARVCRT
jgi:transposase